MDYDAPAGSIGACGGAIGYQRTLEEPTRFDGGNVVIQVATPYGELFSKRMINADQFLPAVVDVPFRVETARNAVRRKQQLAVDVLNVSGGVRIELRRRDLGSRLLAGSREAY